MCDNEVWSAREAHPSLKSRVFIGALSRGHDWLPMGLIHLQPLQKWADTPGSKGCPLSPPYIALLVWLKALILSHCSYLAGPRPPGKQRHSSVTWHSKGLEITFQKQRSDLSLVWPLEGWFFLPHTPSFSSFCWPCPRDAGQCLGRLHRNSGRGRHCSSGLPQCYTRHQTLALPAVLNIRVVAERSRCEAWRQMTTWMPVLDLPLIKH